MFRDRYQKADTVFIHDSVAKVVIRFKADTLLKIDTISSNTIEYIQTPAETPKIVTGLAYIGGIALGILLLVLGIRITKFFI